MQQADAVQGPTVLCLHMKNKGSPHSQDDVIPQEYTF